MNQSDQLKIKKAYSSPSWWYDIRGFFILTLTYHSTLWSQIAFFSKNMKTRHLEVAIGTASLFSFFILWRNICGLERVEGVGLDYSESMLDGAKWKFWLNKSFTLEVGDVTKLPYENECFTTINIANAIHCFSDIKTSLREIKRVLKDDGTIALNVLLYPNKETFWGNLAHRINTWGAKKGILYRPYTKEEFGKLIAEAELFVHYQKVTGNTCNYLLAKADFN